MAVALWRTWLLAYLGVWALTFTGALAVSAAAPLHRPLQSVFALKLTPASTPPPRLSAVLALAGHNIPICCWPLLLGLVGVHRSRGGRRAADVLIGVWLAVNVLPVGAAIGLYGARLAPYVPQLPAEWAALALGAATWLTQRRAALRLRQGAAVFAVSVALLLAAATVETTLVPHTSTGKHPNPATKIADTSRTVVLSRAAGFYVALLVPIQRSGW